MNLKAPPQDKYYPHSENGDIQVGWVEDLK